jgi:hypothetical protein
LEPAIGGSAFDGDVTIYLVHSAAISGNT